MYETYKNAVVADMASSNLNLNEDQIHRILTSMDKAANNFNFYEKTSIADFTRGSNGVPKIVYDYLSCKQSEGLTPETVYGYRIMLELFFKECPKDVHEVTSDDIRNFLTSYQKIHGIKNRTLDKYREYILRFFTWCHEMGYIPKNPGFQCKPIHYETPQRQSLTAYELELLRNACVTARDSAIIETLYSTACRVSELAILKFEDIDWGAGTVHIFGKGSKHRTSFINARAKVALQNYIQRERCGDSEYIFVSERKPYGPLHKESIEKIVSAIADRAVGLNKKVTPHTIRHTTATIALHNGMNINEISMLLGHSNIETTMIYAKTSYDAVKSAHNKYIY